jgi:hypothetical protein
MNERRTYNTVTTRTVAQRRRAHAARLRMAGMRARMAELRSTTAMEHLAGPDHVREPDSAA